MRILLADSGASKTDWAIMDDGRPDFKKSRGLHPAYLEEEEAGRELQKLFGKTRVDRIIFYGAGCSSPESAMPVRLLLERQFGLVPIDLHDDLSAVADAFLGMEEGIAGILGTGSASGYFRSGSRVGQVPSLGYLLGDEGSAAHIGRDILRRMLRDGFGKPATNYLVKRLGSQNPDKVAKRLYFSGRPSYYLAQIAGSVLSGSMPDEISDLVKRCFQSYVDVHLSAYDDYTRLPVVLAGGIAVHARQQLSAVLEQNGICLGRITGSVIEALADRAGRPDELNR